MYPVPLAESANSAHRPDTGLRRVWRRQGAHQRDGFATPGPLGAVQDVDASWVSVTQRYLIQNIVKPAAYVIRKKTKLGALWQKGMSDLAARWQERLAGRNEGEPRSPPGQPLGRFDGRWSNRSNLTLIARTVGGMPWVRARPHLRRQRAWSSGPRHSASWWGTYRQRPGSLPTTEGAERSRSGYRPPRNPPDLEASHPGSWR